MSLAISTISLGFQCNDPQIGVITLGFQCPSVIEDIVTRGGGGSKGKQEALFRARLRREDEELILMMGSIIQSGILS